MDTDYLLNLLPLGFLALAVFGIFYFSSLCGEILGFGCREERDRCSVKMWGLWAPSVWRDSFASVSSSGLMLAMSPHTPPLLPLGLPAWRTKNLTLLLLWVGMWMAKIRPSCLTLEGRSRVEATLVLSCSKAQPRPCSAFWDNMRREPGSGFPGVGRQGRGLSFCCWWQDRRALQWRVEAAAPEGLQSGWRFPGVSAQAVAVPICPFPSRSEAVTVEGPCSRFAGSPGRNSYPFQALID